MKKRLLSLGISIALSTSLSAFEYNISQGQQLLGAVYDIEDFTPFQNKCVNYIYYIDFQDNDNILLKNINSNLTGYDPLVKLDKGQGFILNASGSCSVTIEEPDTITFNGLTYKMVTSPTTNRVWLDRNMGAVKACTKVRSEFSTDEEYKISQEDCFGDYYQWGRRTDGHEKLYSPTTRIRKSNINETNDQYVLNGESPTYYDWASTDKNGAQRTGEMKLTNGSYICPVGFRVPTNIEFSEEAVNMSVVSNILKFPLNGYKSNDIPNKLYYLGYVGSNWTNNNLDKYANAFIFEQNSGNILSNQFRADGRGVRCIKE